MDPLMQVALAATLGVLVQEILHLMELRSRLQEQEVKQLLSSLGYWAITIVWVVVGGATAAVMLPMEAEPNLREALLLGAALPALLKKFAVGTGTGGRHLGHGKSLAQMYLGT